jgi:hypothetical protein
MARVVNDSKQKAQKCGVGMYPDPGERIELVSTSDDKLVGNIVMGSHIGS